VLCRIASSDPCSLLRNLRWPPPGESCCAACAGPAPLVVVCFGVDGSSLSSPLLLAFSESQIRVGVWIARLYSCLLGLPLAVAHCCPPRCAGCALLLFGPPDGFVSYAEHMDEGPCLPQGPSSLGTGRLPASRAEQVVVRSCSTRAPVRDADTQVAPSSTCRVPLVGLVLGADGSCGRSQPLP